MFDARQNTFEGKGGKKFVRIQPNTILEKWYPQLREGQLKTDDCFLCGYSWKDHLEYWWYCRRRQGGVSAAFEHCMETSAIDGVDKFAYHKKYVDEIDSNKRRSHRRGLELRKSLNGEASYLVPPFDPLLADDGSLKSIWSLLLLALARTGSLLRIEELMWLSTVESLRSRQEF